MIDLFAVTAAQAVSSYLSTATLHAAIRGLMPRFVATAAISDTVKLTIYTSVAVMAVRGQWAGIAAAVIGGSIGNALAHRMSRKEVG